MKIVTSRAIGDCGICAIATYLEQTYEDVYVAAAKVDPARRGKLGIHLPALKRIARALGCELKRAPAYLSLESAEGLLVVKWLRGSRHYTGQLFRQHLVVILDGVIIDPCDGVILTADEYLEREKAAPGALLVEAI